MRKDMNKVLTTRPRAGGHSAKLRKIYDKKNQCREKTRYFKGVPMDTSCKRESMRKRYRASGDWKEFTDHIEPLFRYLRSQAGRTWNDVWSDICKELRGTGLQAQHVKQHVKWAVDGIPHSGETSFDAGDWHKPRFGVVYVDEKGILRKNPQPRWEKFKPREPNYTTIDGNTYAKGEHGWCQVRLLNVLPYAIEKSWDALHKRMMTSKELNEFYGRSVRCVECFPLNKKQLKKLGLRKS